MTDTRTERIKQIAGDYLLSAGNYTAYDSVLSVAEERDQLRLRLSILEGAHATFKGNTEAPA